MLPAPEQVRIVRVRTGPSIKRQLSLVRERKIFDEGSVHLSWAPVEGAAWYAVRTSTSLDFVKNTTFPVKLPACMDAEGWHDGDGSWFDCTWYHDWKRCELHGSRGADDECCSCGGGRLVVGNASASQAHQSAPTQYTVPGLIAGQQIFVSVASISASEQVEWAFSSHGPEWSAPVAVIPINAVTSAVSNISWGPYNDTHAHVLWADATSGPAASHFQVTWQECIGGKLTYRLPSLNAGRFFESEQSMDDHHLSRLQGHTPADE